MGGPALAEHIIHIYGFAEGLLPHKLITAFHATNPHEKAFGIVMRLEEGGKLS